jgi:hypothetical protein
MEKSEKHLAALAYARKGIPVFPTLADDPDMLAKDLKQPACAGGFKSATCDVGQIDAWWTRNPNFNVAASPDDAGMCVLDIDEPGALLDLELEFGVFPATLTSRTRSGGLHIWFKGRLGSTQKRRPGVDTRGENSYVLLPPSEIHGQRYTWVDRTPAVPLPENLIPVFGPKDTNVATAETDVAKDLPAAIQRAREMCRNFSAGSDPKADDNAAYLHACQLNDQCNLSIPVLADILHHEWNLRLDDPMDYDRIMRKAINTKYKQNPPGAWAVAPAEELFAELIANLPTVPDHSRPSRFRLLNEAEQDALPDPTWLIKDILPAKAIAVLYAPSQAWKTFLALDWAMSIAANHDKWGPVEQGAVVYIAAEGATGLGKLRRPAWRKVHGIPDDQQVPFWVSQEMPRVNKKEEFIEFCEEVKAKCGTPKLVILDTLARSMLGLDESHAKDAGEAIETCEFLKRALNCTVLALHHTGKDSAKGLRGSSAFIAGFDSALELETDKENMVAKVWAKKHKDSELREYPWVLKASKVFGSLVFQTATEADLPLSDRLMPSEVGAALEKMEVFDKATPCLEFTLVYELAAMKGWDQKKMTRAFRALVKTGRLQAYVVKPGMYYFPKEAEQF